MSRRKTFTQWFKWLVGLCALAAVSAAYANETSWTVLSDTLFTHHTAPEAGAGTSIAQDGTGFIWIGAQGGLARWDGYRFHRYTADAQTPGSLPDSFILSLYVDSKGRLWVGTSSGGLARYDEARDAFVVSATGTAGGLSDPSVSAITGDDTGGLWIGTGAGLDHLNTRGVVERNGAAAEFARGLPRVAIQALLLDRSGSLWAGTRQGLWRRKPGEQSFLLVHLASHETQEPAITKLFEDSSGHVWIGTSAQGAFLFASNKARAVTETDSTSNLQSDGVVSIAEVTPGKVWLGTNGDGIVEVDLTHGATRRIRHYADTPSSLSDNEIWAMFRDRSGLMWVATSTATSQHDPHQQWITTLLGGTGRPQGISQSNVYYTLPMRDGRVWLSVGAGIDIVDPSRGRVAQLLPDVKNPNGALPKGRVQALAQDAQGNVFIATQQGLYLSDTNGHSLTRLQIPGRDVTAAVRALCWDNGTLWMGGTTDGLWKLDVRLSRRPVLLSHADEAQLGDARISSIKRGKDESLWVGTRSVLTRVDISTGAIERLPTSRTDVTQLPGGFISSTLVDRQGRLWVSTFGAGVQVSAGRDSQGVWRFRRLSLRDGLPHAGIDTLLEDRSGDIWASTDDGLAIIDPVSFVIRKLQRPQGVTTRSFWTNSGAMTDAGELLFGGVGGLVIVRPDLMTPWQYRAPIAVTNAYVGNSPLSAGRFNLDPSLSDVLNISHLDRGLRVEFSALDYSAPERNRYSYRLLGFDDNWIAADPISRQVSYTNLPPGDFTLQLRGSNREGEWSAPLQKSIRVLPAWYQTLWFRGAMLLGAVGLVFALIQARTIILRGRQRELQALVAERTAELEQRTNELRESQRQLQEIAYADPLTGLPNRRHFDDTLRRAVAESARGGSPFTLLLIDLDGFKKVNDTLGHDAGDVMLNATAFRLHQAVRAVDCVARLGGDEFAILLSQTSELAAVEIVCRRILTSLAEPVPFKERTMRVSASIGSALCPSQGTDVTSLYKSADIALYDAKHSGRNTWRWYAQTSTGAARARLAEMPYDFSQF